MENQLLDSDMLNNKEGKSLNALLSNGYETHSLEYLKKGFELFKQNAGGFIGFILLAFFARIICGVIPVIGSIISIFLIPLTIGVNIVAKKIDKNEHYEFSNFFDGFQKLGPIIGNAIIQALIAIAVLLVMLIPFLLIYGVNLISSLENSNFSDSRIILFIILMFIMAIVLMFIFVGWTLSSQLIVFNNNSPWQAMEISRKIVTKKYFNWLGFILLIGLVNIVGAICLIIGLLVTVPTTLCAMYVAYEDVVGLNLKD